jgi:hypothetical protein
VARPAAAEPAVVLRPDRSPSVVDIRDGVEGRTAEPTPSIDIRWSDEGACTVELRGRPTRSMLTEARDILWSRTPSDRLTVVVTDAVLTRNLFALLIAGRRRLSSSGVFEIVGLDAPGARRIADSRSPASSDDA